MLSKKDKRIARELIEKGLQAEFRHGLLEMDPIIQQWKNKQSENREAYHNLYKALTDFDKHIAIRYDRITGSRYVYTSCAAPG